MKRLAAALAAVLTVGASAASAHPHHGYWVYRGHWWPAYHDVYVPPPGWVERRWVVGDVLPPPYYGPRYVIVDWRAHHLRRPPPGYHWVRVGDDVVLAAIATGAIAEIIHDVYG